MISNSIKSGSLSTKSEELRKKGPNDVRSGRVADGQKATAAKQFGTKKATRIVVRNGKLELSRAK
jgi:hypothetical protein